MNAIIESLNELHKRILAHSEEVDGYSIKLGLRIAAAMVEEEIENQKTCAEVDAMSDEDVLRFIGKCEACAGPTRAGEICPDCVDHSR